MTALPRCRGVRVAAFIEEERLRRLSVPRCPQRGGGNAEAVGLAVTAGGSRSKSDIAAFVTWLFSGGRDIKLALQCSLVPAQNGMISTARAVERAKLGGGIRHAGPGERVFIETEKAAFEAEFGEAWNSWPDKRHNGGGVLQSRAGSAILYFISNTLYSKSFNEEVIIWKASEFLK